MMKLEPVAKEQLEKIIMEISEILNSSELNKLEELRKNFQESTQDIQIASDLTERIHIANINAQQLQDSTALMIDKMKYIIEETEAINID